MRLQRLTLAVAGSLALLCLALPAKADPPWRGGDGWRGGWRGHEWREHHGWWGGGWRRDGWGWPGVYGYAAVPPPVVYAPPVYTAPPAYYAPPPVVVAPGINFGVHIP